jgi:hypothetical protein
MVNIKYGERRMCTSALARVSYQPMLIEILVGKFEAPESELKTKNQN